MSRGTRPSYPIEDNKGRRTGQGSKGQPQAHGQAEWLRHLDRGRSCNPRPGVVSWFGGAAPGDNLPDISHFKVAKHTKGDGAGTKNYRKDHRLVKRSGFTKLKTLDHVLVKLFGALPVERPVQWTSSPHSTRRHCLPLSPPPGSPPLRLLERLRPISASGTRGGPTTAPKRGSWPGAQVSRCRRSPPSIRSMSRHGSRRQRASWPRRPSSNARAASPVRVAGQRPGRAPSTGRTRCGGPRHIVTIGRTPVLDPAEAKALLDNIDVSTPAGLRERRADLVLVYSFARRGAALGMAVEDFTGRTAGSVSGCARKAANGVRCGAITISNTLSPISTARGCASIRGRCSAGSAAAPANLRAPCCRRRTSTRWSAGGRRWPDRYQAQKSQLPGNRDHRLSLKRRHILNRHDAVLRPPSRWGQPRCGRADRDWLTTTWNQTILSDGYDS